MDLQNPLGKMGKSDSGDTGRIALIDDSNIVAKRIKSAVTDSGREIIYDKTSDEKAGIRNLLAIYSTDTPIETIVNQYTGKGYGDLKKDLAEIVVEKLKPIKTTHDDLMKNKDYLNEVLKRSADNAQKMAYRTLSKVYRKIGLVEPKR